MARGAPGVDRHSSGKSSLTVRFVDGHFVDSYYPTIENTFSKVIKHRGNDFATEIVDTAGQVSAPASPLGFLFSRLPKAACCSKRPKSNLYGDPAF